MFALTELNCMRKTKIRILTLITFVTLVFGCAFLALPKVSATAAGEYTPTAVFSAGNGGTVGATTAGEGEDSFVQFTLAEDGVVNYRHDLALKWFAPNATDAIKGDKTYFSLNFALPEINFSSLVLTFESAQENITKEGVTSNSVVFKAEGGAVTVAVQADGVAEAPAGVAVADPSNITLAFTDDLNGEFTLTCNGAEVGKLTNIGGYYMEYISSAEDDPRIPLAFKANLQEGKSEQLVVVKEMNGQSFKLTEGKVVDNAAPALVVNEKLNSFALGYKFSLTYLAVDVLDESITTERKYVYAEEIEGVVPAANDEKVAGREASEGVEAIVSKYDTLSTSTPLQAQSSGSNKEYVAVRFKLTDDRATAGTENDYIYLSWYCNPTGETDATEQAKDNELLAKGYIPVLRDEEGPVYNCVTNDDSAKTSTLDESAIVAYQTLVTEASKTAKVGEGAYFYLPSLRALVSDKFTDYNNLKFNIYYKNQTSSSSQSATALKYNALRFELDKEGAYSFRVVATDKLGNAIKVYNDEGLLVAVDSSNVWDLDCIPEFTFTTMSMGAEIEESGEQSIGYLDSKYTVSKFNIIALDGYKVSYKLYYLDASKVPSGSMPSYAQMVASPAQYEEYLEEISESDEDVEWNASDLTFRPQEAGFYFVKAEVIDAVNPQTTVAYQVIEVRNKIDVVQGETYWLENNVASVVLFSISGVLLIAIVVLWLVKPSEKTVEEVDLKQLKGNKKSKEENESEE